MHYYQLNTCRCVVNQINARHVHGALANINLFNLGQCETNGIGTMRGPCCKQTHSTTIQSRRPHMRVQLRFTPIIMKIINNPHVRIFGQIVQRVVRCQFAKAMFGNEFEGATRILGNAAY